MNIYVASSWRNDHQQGVVKALRGIGCEVYDFRNPAPGDSGFHWSEIDPDWLNWTPERFREALNHPIAHGGFAKDREALDHADATVLVLPCGRSAHLELGYAIGRGQPTLVYAPEPTEPELMYMLTNGICVTMMELLETMRGWACFVGSMWAPCADLAPSVSVNDDDDDDLPPSGAGYCRDGKM